MWSYLAAALGVAASGAYVGYRFTCNLKHSTMFQPVRERTPVPSNVSAAAYGTSGGTWHAVHIGTEDGEELTGWYYLHPASTKLVVAMHGNAGSIRSHLRMFDYVCAAHSLLLVDYRGYGESTGTPSEAGLIKDGVAMVRYALERLTYRASNIVLYGMSLGTGVAVQVAHRIPHLGGLILQSGFARCSNLAPPVVASVVTEFNSIGVIEEVAEHTPVLVMHSRDDEVIPFREAQQMARTLGHRAQYLITEGTHNEPIRSAAVINDVVVFVETGQLHGGEIQRTPFCD